MAANADIRTPARRAGVLVGLAVLLLLAPPAMAGAVLRVWSGEPPRLAFSQELQAGQAIQLEHRNSIYDAPVRETYVLGDGGRLIQVELMSPSAGVFEYYGFDPPPAGRVALEREVSVIRLRSTSYEHHRLRLGGRTIQLKDLAQPGQVLRLEVDRP